jgi:hypothetical protein
VLAIWRLSSARETGNRHGAGDRRRAVGGRARLRGEFDVDTASTLDDARGDAIREIAGALGGDLSVVECLDPSGSLVLVRAGARRPRPSHRPLRRGAARADES